MTPDIEGKFKEYDIRLMESSQEPIEKQNPFLISKYGKRKGNYNQQKIYFFTKYNPDKNCIFKTRTEKKMFYRILKKNYIDVFRDFFFMFPFFFILLILLLLSTPYPQKNVIKKKTFFF